MVGAIHRRHFVGSSPRGDLRPVPRLKVEPGHFESHKEPALGLAPQGFSRASKSHHRLDPDRTPLDLATGRARIGAGYDRLYGAVRSVSSRGQRADLEHGRLSTSSFYRLAAKGVFGCRAGHTMRYADIRARMIAFGLESELEAMLERLPRPLLRKLRKHGLMPAAIFAERGREVASWRSSTNKMTLDDLRAELSATGRSDQLALLGRLDASDIAALENGDLTGVQVARLLARKAMEDVDVLIIGAGASGIGAANTLLDRGHRIAILEAKNRTGGRAYTETTSLAVPFDHGCAWIHESKENPLMPIVEALGFETIPTEKFQKAFAGGDPREDAHILEHRLEQIAGRWARVAKRRPDAKASMASVPERRIDPLALGVLGPLEMSVERDRFSVGEFSSGIEERDDRMVIGGLGNVVKAFSYGLPVSLDTRVDVIRWGKEGVEVRSGDRTFRAKKVLITLSPDAIGKRIVFDPPLPEWKTTAIASLHMASFEKIALEFDPSALAKISSFERACAFDSQGHPIELLLKPFGVNAGVVMVGGDWSRKLLENKDDEVIAYALEELSRIYGPELKGAFRRGFRTHWSDDPDFGGTWAVTEPGAGVQARKAYAKPVDDTIFIGGEACGGRWAATVNGAFVNGTDVAKEIDAALRPHSPLDSASEDHHASERGNTIGTKAASARLVPLFRRESCAR